MKCPLLMSSHCLDTEENTYECDKECAWLIEQYKGYKHCAIAAIAASGKSNGEFFAVNSLGLWKYPLKTCGEARGFLPCDLDNFGNPSCTEFWCEKCDIELDDSWVYCPLCGSKIIRS